MSASKTREEKINRMATEKNFDGKLIYSGTLLKKIVSSIKKESPINKIFEKKPLSKMKKMELIELIVDNKKLFKGIHARLEKGINIKPEQINKKKAAPKKAPPKKKGSTKKAPKKEAPKNNQIIELEKLIKQQKQAIKEAEDIESEKELKAELKDLKGDLKELKKGSKK
jgi:hydroxymethylpyrimidine pyrophosphatase-like HAD family hydrolase